MNQQEMLKALRKNNPFTSSSAGDPWKEKRQPDVKSVNKHAFDGILGLIRQKREDAGHECAGLVLGEVGSGKTHLIGRILAHGREGSEKFSFAYIQPIEDPEQTYRYLLREVIINLSHRIEADSNMTQLEIILVEILKEVMEREMRRFSLPKKGNILGRLRKNALSVLKKGKFNSSTVKGLGNAVKGAIKERLMQEEGNPFETPFRRIQEDPTVIFSSHEDHIPEMVEQIAFNMMMEEYPEISEEFLKVLFSYRKSTHRRAAMSWLKGSILDGKDEERFKMPGRQGATDASLEQEAREILNSLGILLGRYRMPLVICFDRLENLDDDAQIRSFGKMVEFLNDKAKTMLPIVFVRGQGWIENFALRLNQQVITRLETNKFEMKDCTRDQAREIIIKRLDQVLPQRREGDIFPFEEEDINRIFKSGRFYSPRTVITLANDHLGSKLGDMTRKLPTPFEKLKEAFESQFLSIMDDMDRFQPDRSRLRRALEFYLCHDEADSGITIEFSEPPEEALKYADVFCNITGKEGKTVTAYFVIDIEQHNSPVRASIKRSIDFIKRFPQGKGFYIRDERRPIPEPPRWGATNEMLEDLKKMGGRVLILQKEEVARWYALALLGYSVKEGEVTVMEFDNTSRPVSNGELYSFIRKGIHREKVPGFDLLNEEISI